MIKNRVPFLILICVASGSSEMEVILDYLKIIFYGVISSIVFMFFTLIFGNWIGIFIFKDAYELSYHMFTRMGLIVLSGIIITCTIIIVKKLNEVNEFLKNHK